MIQAIARGGVQPIMVEYFREGSVIDKIIAV